MGMSTYGQGGGGASLRQQAIGLFDGGVKGVLLDISDLSKMFQERTGASATTPAVVDGPVGTIASQVNGHYAVVPTADGRRPTLRLDGVTGEYYLEFVAASSQNLQVASLILSNRMYVGRAVRNGAVAQFIVEHGVNAVGNDGFFFTDIAASCWIVRRSAANNVRAPAAGSWIGLTDTVCEFDYSATARKVYANGLEVVLSSAETGVQAVSSNVTAALNIGARNNTTFFFTGRLYGLVVWDGSIATNDRLILRRWLGEISGISIPFLRSAQPTSYKIYQRSGSGSTNVTINGTYNQPTTTVEANFKGGAFQVVDAAPAAGVYSGTMALPDEQGTMEVRPSNSISNTQTFTNVGVGDVFVAAGQSNASGQPGSALQSYSHATLKAGLFGNDDVWRELADPTDSNTGQIDSVSSDATSGGTVWPLIATAFMALRSMPFGLVPCAKGGSAISAWARNGSTPGLASTLYGSMYRRINAIGGVKAVLWWQGESDAILATTQAAYYAALNTLADNVASDFGIPLIVAQIGHVQGATGANVQAIRQAQLAAWTGNANLLRGPTLYDVTLSVDGLHFSTNGQIATAAERWWAAINSVLYGASGGRGPQLASATHNAGKTVITLTFTGDNLPLATSTLTKTAFTVKDDAVGVTISTAVKTGNTTIDLTLAAPAVGAITVSLAALELGYGAVVPMNSGTPALPAEMFIDVATTLL